ncbi:MAG: glycosyltransferase [Candidatus Tectomicrobia bacterium]|nr:glycosyltransferase [Candidatus Tectomicrobia bacterium]
MRFFVINGDYTLFLSWFYATYPELRERPYDEQLRVRHQSFCGMADFYPSHLRRLGHEAVNVWGNDEVLQRTWAKEHGVQVKPEGARDWRFRLRRGWVPWLDRVPSQEWLYKILEAQIRHYNPDVLLNFEVGMVSSEFLRTMRRELGKTLRLVIGWGSAVSASYQEDWSVYDLMLVPQEGMATYFQGKGVRTELIRHAFEPRVLSVIGAPERTIPVSFAGIMHNRVSYKTRRELLERLCTELGGDMSMWAPALGDLPPASAIRQRHQGEAWAREFYRVLARSNIVVNCHGDLEGRYAANIRLFEATGMGALVVTDWKENLPRLFEPGKEVVAYRHAEECVDLVHYYLHHAAERLAIAHAGHQRTLREHTYEQRAQEVVQLIGTYL